MKKSLIAGTALAGVALAGAIAVGTNAFAETPTASPTTSTAAPSADPTTSTTAGTATPSAGSNKGTDQGRQRGGGQGASKDTAVTGDEAQKVIDAVQAKNTGVTITTVRKDPDGSYDALGTKSDGTKVFYEVSTDLATITEHTGGGKGGGGRDGGRGGASQDTAVTGDEAQKVIDAVQAKNTGVTITTVRKDPDGSYDALGTRSDGTKVFYDVSTDLKTITEHTR